MLVIGVPIVLLVELISAWCKWRRVPLQQKNHTRAGAGAFVLTALAIYVVHRGGFSSMMEFYCVAGLAVMATLYLIVGITGSQGARFDFLALFWWSLAALACAALLAFGFPF